jgi:hypothetical protein
MAKKQEKIRDKAVEIVKNNPDGIRLADLKKELETFFQDDSNIDENSIGNAVWNLEEKRENEIDKPARGLFTYKKIIDTEKELLEKKEIEEIKDINKAINEDDFYEPFAKYLKQDLNECTESVPLGGNFFGKKWSTPDVLGIYKPSHRDTIKFNYEIISAEIKINPSEPIVAFGQAVAYRLFSSKVYLVEPETISPYDFERIEALCILFGIGLILFKLNPKEPDFKIRVRAQKYIPDMFYVNRMLDKLFETKNEIFKKLFS